MFPNQKKLNSFSIFFLIKKPISIYIQNYNKNIKFKEKEIKFLVKIDHKLNIAINSTIGQNCTTIITHSSLLDIDLVNSSITLSFSLFYFIKPIFNLIILSLFLFFFLIYNFLPHNLFNIFSCYIC